VSTTEKLAGATNALKEKGGGENSRVESEASIVNMDDNVKANLNEVSAIENFINRIESEGLNLEDVFNLLDKDKDEVLSSKEIRDNIGRLNLNLNPQEIEEFINVLDKNTDGIISKPEFISCLEDKLALEKEYNSVMGEIKDVNNPLILEERRLDLKFRKTHVEKLLQTELKKEALCKIDFNILKEELDSLETIFMKKATKNRPSMEQLKRELEMLSLEVRSLNFIGGMGLLTLRSLIIKTPIP
jgi:Ca2+-binding EF-hand superfamily protein